MATREPEVASGSGFQRPKLEAVPEDDTFDGAAGNATRTSWLEGTSKCNICGVGYVSASYLAYCKDPEPTDLYNMSAEQPS